ncbi:MAG: hypothetical protein ACR2ND_14635 [Solirubrobacteraceae bacterium]
MSPRPLAVLLILVLADWGAWTWSIGAGHGTLSLLAGLLMAPLFVALLWLATMTASSLARAAAARVLQLPRAPPSPRPARRAAAGDTERRRAA